MLRCYIKIKNLFYETSPIFIKPEFAPLNY